MLDKDLYFAENARTGILPAPNVWGVAPLPSLVEPAYYDFRVITDLARATPVYANFRLASPFDNVADNLLRFAVFVSDNPTFVDLLTNRELVLARSHDISSPGLVDVGQIIQVALPPVGDLLRVLGEGRRYMSLGFEYMVPTTDWSTGGIDAFLTRHPLPLRPLSSPSGY